MIYPLFIWVELRFFPFTSLFTAHSILGHHKMAPSSMKSSPSPVLRHLLQWSYLRYTCKHPPLQGYQLVRCFSCHGCQPTLTNYGNGYRTITNSESFLQSVDGAPATVKLYSDPQSAVVQWSSFWHELQSELVMSVVPWIAGMTLPWS